MKKHSFMKEEIVYLEFFICVDGLRIDLEKVKVIIEWPKNENMSEVRSFHQLERLYRMFIRNFISDYNSKTKKMKGDKKDFQRTDGADKFFETLKQ